MIAGLVDSLRPVRFEDLPEQTWPRQEIIDGSLLVTPAPGELHQNVVSNVFVALHSLVPSDYKVYTGLNVLHRAPDEEDRLLIPDVLVVDRTAVAGHPVMIPPSAVLLAVEVISPSTRATDVYLKRGLYSDWGIGLYWLIDPVQQQIQEFGSGSDQASWLNQVDQSTFWKD